ncbi:MAG TPA: tRNA lysidine(34) synthetase TilS [Thermoflexales bacterium]|nr:tRNA lysidine(34) synthetase TilS [Thermoflexales bacterium]
MTPALQRLPLLARRALDQAMSLDGARAVFPARVVVAVSGGADSIALLDILVRLDDRLSVVIAHFNHQLRGTASDQDAFSVEAAALARGLPFRLGGADVAAAASRAKQSIEVAARQARYAFLAGIAAAEGARWIATAHHADDQAETVLLRLLRGTGTLGLRGMALLSPMPGHPALRLWRPLLLATRAEILAYCEERALTFCVDASNRDTRALRNRIRHELIPYLESYNPGIRKVLARLAENAAADGEIIEAGARSALDSLRRSGGAFDRGRFCALSAGLRRATLRLACADARGDLTDLRAAGIEEAIDALAGPAAHADIAVAPGTRIQVAGGLFLVIAMRETDP